MAMMEGGGAVDLAATLTPAPSQPPRALSDFTNVDPAQREARREARGAAMPCREPPGAPGRHPQPQPDGGADEHEPPRPPTADNPNDRLGVVPEHAKRFPVEEASDHIVLAFFRLGQFWETVEEAGKPPAECRPANIDEVQEQRRERRGRELPRRKQCEALKNRLGVCAIAASRNVVLLVTLIGPWLPMLLHSFVYTHGFLHNTICP